MYTGGPACRVSLKLGCGASMVISLVLFRAGRCAMSMQLVKWYGSSTDIEDRSGPSKNCDGSEAQRFEAQRVAKSPAPSVSLKISTASAVRAPRLLQTLIYQAALRTSKCPSAPHPEDRAFVEQQLTARHTPNDLITSIGADAGMPVKHVMLSAHAVSSRGGSAGGSLERWCIVTATKQAEEKLHRPGSARTLRA